MLAHVRFILYEPLAKRYAMRTPRGWTTTDMRCAATAFLSLSKAERARGDHYPGSPMEILRTLTLKGSSLCTSARNAGRA